MEPVTQQDRINGAASLKGDDAKTVLVRELILRGEADNHPLVRGSADARELAQLNSTELNALRKSLGVL